jgi:hypothetical protein
MTETSCPACKHDRNAHSVQGCAEDGCRCDRTRREVDLAQPA